MLFGLMCWGGDAKNQSYRDVHKGGLCRQRVMHLYLIIIFLSLSYLSNIGPYHLSRSSNILRNKI